MACFFYNQSSVNATSVANLPIKIWCISRFQKKPKINSEEEAAKIFFCSALTVLNRLSPPLLQPYDERYVGVTMLW